jgi:hypothetical protein
MVDENNFNDTLISEAFKLENFQNDDDLNDYLKIS